MMDWADIIDNWDIERAEEFIERYQQYIPLNKFQTSRLWDKLVEVKAERLLKETIYSIYKLLNYNSMPLWKFTTKNKRQCNGVFVERGMTVEVVTPTTSNPLHNPQGREQIAAAFMTKYGVDMKKAQMLTSSYLDYTMSK